jgi:predicted small secreted protein
MKTLLMSILLAAAAWGQQTNTKQGAGADIGSGASSVGKGAAKGAGHVAKGTAEGAVDLATLHPVDAGISIGGGAASAGKNVTVGTAKGAGKIGRGVGKVFKKVF